MKTNTNNKKEKAFEKLKEEMAFAIIKAVFGIPKYKVKILTDLISK